MLEQILGYFRLLLHFDLVLFNPLEGYFFALIQSKPFLFFLHSCRYVVVAVINEALQSLVDHVIVDGPADVEVLFDGEVQNDL